MDSAVADIRDGADHPPPNESESPFQFQFQLAYDDAVENKLYTFDTHGLALPYHVLQRKSGKRLFCLLCHKGLPFPPQEQAFTVHFQQHGLNMENDRVALNAYHETFLKLDKQYQMQQVFFVPCTLHTVECQACYEWLPVSAVLSHCSDMGHVENASKKAMDYWEEAQASICPNVDLLDDKLKQLKLTEPKKHKMRDKKPSTQKMHSLVFVNKGITNKERLNAVPNDMQIEVSKVVPSEMIEDQTTIMESSKSSTASNYINVENISDDGSMEMFNFTCNSFNYCSLCKKVITTSYKMHSSAVEHINLSEHAKFHKLTAVRDTVRFDRAMLKVMSIYCNYKKFFIPASRKYCRCLICNKNVAYKDVNDHLRMLPCAFVYATAPIYDSHVDFAQLRKEYLAEKQPLQPHAVEIIDRFYSPSKLFDQIRHHDGLPVDAMQRRGGVANGEYLHCLLCDCNIAVFSGIEEDDERVMLIHVKQVKHKLAVYCRSKLTALFSYHEYFAQRDLPLRVRMLQDCVNIERLGFGCEYCGTRFDIAEFAAHAQACGHYDARSPHAMAPKAGNTDEKMAAKQGVAAAADADTVNSDLLASAVTPHANAHMQPLTYDDETMLQVYPTCNTPRGQRRPGVLTVQARGAFEKYCLACACSVYVRGTEHISSARHEQAVTNRMDCLRAYHTFWMCQSPGIQLLQVYFNPQSATTIGCVGCRERKVYFHDVCWHSRCVDRFRQRNAGYVVGAEFATFEIAYERNAVRFFYGAHYDISRNMLGTDIPIAHVYRKYCCCLMCTDPKKAVMSRNEECWKHHLVKFHRMPGGVRDKQLRRVMDFHNFWAAQPAEHQLYLVYYMSSPTGGVMCDSGHAIQLQEAVRHAEGGDGANCRLREIIEQKARGEKMQRPRQDADEENGGEERRDYVLNGTQDKVHPIELLYAYTESTDDGNVNGVKLPIYLAEHVPFFTHMPGNEQQFDVECTVCALYMKDDELTLRLHASSVAHQLKIKKKVKRVKIVYNCDVCLEKMRTEEHWLDHLKADKHLQNVKNLPQIRSENMAEHFCRACCNVIFGDGISLMRHGSVNDRELKKKPGLLTGGMKQLLKDRASIDGTAAQHQAACVQFQLDSQPKVDQCVSDLEALMKQVYPSCRIHPFGSRVAGFVMQDSDLDLFVDIGDRYLGSDPDSQADRKFILEVKKLLWTEPKRYVDLYAVLTARVPIVKVVHAPTALDCDLSFSNGLSVENSKLIRFYADLQPAFGGAMLFLKEWGARMTNKLKGDITSYALCMMVIFNMQVDGYLPSVHRLRQLSTFDVPNIDGWDTLDYAKLDRSALVESLKKPVGVADVVLSFFAYYGSHFCYSKMVACPLLGRAFPVQLFENKGEKTPAEMHTYRQKVAVDPDALFRVSARMFVQDPFDLGHNVTKLAPLRFVNSFEKQCRLSHQHVAQ